MYLHSQYPNDSRTMATRYSSVYWFLSVLSSDLVCWVAVESTESVRYGLVRSCTTIVTNYMSSFFLCRARTSGVTIHKQHDLHDLAAPASPSGPGHARPLRHACSNVEEKWRDQSEFRPCELGGASCLSLRHVCYLVSKHKSKYDRLIYLIW